MQLSQVFRKLKDQVPKHTVMTFFQHMQDDPEGYNQAPSRKAWVKQLTVIKEVDFQRYVASRHIRCLIDPTALAPTPHGRDKWDLMAAELSDDPELTTWPAMGVKDVE